MITLGSKRPDHFRRDDLDLMGQIATQISLALDNALAYEKLNASRNVIEQERLYLESEIRAEYNFEDIVGKSAALRKVLQQIEIVAPTDSTVLLHGETGTGKELVARAIHGLSSRQRPHIRSPELCSHSLRAGRERAFWPRKGRIHRRVDTEEGTIRNRRSGHVIPR